MRSGDGCQNACDRTNNFWYESWWQDYQCPLERVLNPTDLGPDGQVEFNATTVAAAPVSKVLQPVYPAWTWNLDASLPQDGKRRKLRGVLSL
jgi:hypothetical protein